MRVTVHGANIDLENVEYTNIGEVIDAIEAAGYVVTEVFADEQNITYISEEELEKIKPIQELKIYTRNVKELTNETLMDVENYLNKFISGIDEVLNLFSQGQEAESFHILSQGLEGLQWLNSLLVSLIRMGRLDGKTEFIKKWQETMEELLDAMERQDGVLLNDILEYELIPVLETYLEFVRELNLDDQS